MIDQLTNISSKTPIAMLPDVVNHNNEMIKSEIYPESIVNGTKTLPNLKSLCNENGEIQRSINIDSENTFKINHGEVTNDLNVFGKVVTNGVITKELTINEKVSFNKTALNDFIEKYRYAFSNILSDDVVESKLDAALSKKYQKYGDKTILEYKIDQYITGQGEGVINQMVNTAVSAASQNIKSALTRYIDEMIIGATTDEIDDLFDEN